MRKFFSREKEAIAVESLPQQKHFSKWECISRHIILAAFLIVGIILFAIGISGLPGFIHNWCQPTVGETELLTLSILAFMVFLGFSIIYSPLQEYSVGFSLFRSSNSHWVNKPFQSGFAILTPAAVLSLVPFFVMVILLTIHYGLPTDGSIMVPRYWANITVLSSYLLAVLGITLYSSFTYSRVSIDQTTLEVCWQKRRWLLRPKLFGVGKALKLEVLPSQALEGCAEVNPQEERGWLTLRTTKELIPLRLFYADSEKSYLEALAITWNEKLGLSK